MSDEDRDDEGDRNRAEESGLLDMEAQRLHSPELRMLELFERLTTRVETSEENAERRAEETQRNIDFIIRQQAQFTADMQQMREVQAHAEEKWERSWGHTEESIRDLLAIAQIQSQEISTLADAQSQLSKVQAEAQTRTDRQMAETDERLNALVNVVERLISERRNGGANAD
jgi:predicted  nucleic acid-binding Zn-ribbon protein